MLAVHAAARHGASASGIGLVLGFGALHQGALLYQGSLPAWELSPGAVGQTALLGLALSGLAALRALRRTTRERDKAEDLHWDSMESVRVMSELAARPGADLSEKLRTVLDLGAVRFGLDLGVAWCEGSGGDGRVIGLRAPAPEPRPAEMLAPLLPVLREVARSVRPQAIFAEAAGPLPGLPESAADRRGASPPVLFGVSVRLDGEAHGALAFAGTRSPEDRFTATDKDLLGLMGHWLSTELERRVRASAPVAEAPKPKIRRPLLPRRGRDLNAALERAEPALRRRVGVDALLELSPDPKLPKARPGQLSLSTLVESVVNAAARVAPAGRIRVETGQQSGADPVGDLVLRVSVEADTLDALAFERIFEDDDAREIPHGALPLPRLSRLLRRDGGDLSVAVEPRRGAVLTAYLPAQPAAPARRAAATQPSR